MDLMDEFGFDVLRTLLPAREKELLHKLKKEYETTFKFKGKIWLELAPVSRLVFKIEVNPTITTWEQKYRDFMIRGWFVIGSFQIVDTVCWVFVDHRFLAFLDQ